MKLSIARTLPALLAVVPTALQEALGPPTTDGTSQFWRLEKPIEVNIASHAIGLEPLSEDRLIVRTSTRGARFITGTAPVRRRIADDRTELTFRVPCQLRVLGLAVQLTHWA